MPAKTRCAVLFVISLGVMAIVAKRTAAAAQCRYRTGEDESYRNYHAPPGTLLRAKDVAWQPNAVKLGQSDFAAPRQDQ
jgi:hypothetical protein